MTIVNVAMPDIGRTLHASGAALQLVVAGYTVSYAMLLITGARLGALFGRRRLFLTGVALFTASSLVRGLAPDVTVLIVARFVQGAGAAAMVPQIISVIQARFTGAGRTRALSACSAVLAAGFAAGQVAGGVIVSALLNLRVLRSPGIVSGLATVTLAMVAYGGFLFSLSLHMQDGLGYSALRAGLTFAPCAAAFGLSGYYWSRLPERLHQVLTPAGLALAAGTEVVLGLDLRAGTGGGLVFPLLLLVLGAALGVGFSPPVTQPSPRCR